MASWAGSIRKACFSRMSEGVFWSGEENSFAFSSIAFYVAKIEIDGEDEVVNFRTDIPGSHYRDPPPIFRAGKGFLVSSQMKTSMLCLLFVRVLNLVSQHSSKSLRYFLLELLDSIYLVFSTKKSINLIQWAIKSVIYLGQSQHFRSFPVSTFMITVSRCVRSQR